VRLVRSIDSADLTPVVVPPRPDLRALVVVSSPSDLGRFNLAEVDVDGEVARARAALGDIPTTVLGDHAGAAGRATLANLIYKGLCRAVGLSGCRVDCQADLNLVL
jgi:hypothetical protein